MTASDSTPGPFISRLLGAANLGFPVVIRRHKRVYNCTQMVVEWEPGKARLNARKHGIHFADAVSALEDDQALTQRDFSSSEEERWVTIGLDALGRVLVVVYTWRGESLRLISARNATRRERRMYEEPK